MKPGLLAITPLIGSIMLILPSVGAAAQVDINVNIGSQPPVIVAPPPPVLAPGALTMLFLQEPAVYVAVGIPYNIFFVGGNYYYAHGDDWFWAPGYDGPWMYVTYRSLPPGLQRYKLKQLHVYRDREYETYRKHGPEFSQRRIVAVRNGHGKGRRQNDQGENEDNQ